MFLRDFSPPLHLIVAVPVFVIILGAAALSAEAVRENLRFINGTGQLLGLVDAVKAVAANQKSFVATPGEDLWADLVGAGRISASASRQNPWKGDIRATTVPNMSIRIESDLPPHVCSRIALFLLGKQPTELGLTAIDAQGSTDSDWKTIYPFPSAAAHDLIAENACGNASFARLALIFKIR